MEDDPFALSLRNVMEIQYRTRTYIDDLLSHANTNDIEVGFNELKTKLLVSNSSRRIVYRDLNPNLSVHSVYNTKDIVSEHRRVAFTRFCVSAHSLAIEVGRRNRRGRGRLPIEERTCVCSQIQTEVHVTQQCILTQQLTDSCNISYVEELFSDKYSDALTCEIIYQILAVYQ